MSNACPMRLIMTNWPIVAKIITSTGRKYQRQPMLICTMRPPQMAQPAVPSFFQVRKIANREGTNPIPSPFQTKNKKNKALPGKGKEEKREIGFVPSLFWRFSDLEKRGTAGCAFGAPHRTDATLVGTGRGTPSHCGGGG